MTISDKCNIAGLKSLLKKIEFIKPVWVMNVEKNILKTVIKKLDEKKPLIFKITIPYEWLYQKLKKIFKRRE